MARKLAFSHFVMVFAIANIVKAEKYGRNANRVDKLDLDDIDKSSMMGREFRSRQVIQVWQKADRMNLAQNKMKDLHRELLRIDGMYHKLKKEGSVKNQDNRINRGGPEGPDMAIQKQLRDVMQKYGMDGTAGRERRMKFDNDTPFEDRKVAQLWLKAQKSNQFTKEELEELKEELSKHEEKQKSFDKLMTEIHGEDGTRANSADRFGNKNPEEVRQLRIKEMELKLQHREIAKEFEKISVKTMPEEERGPFTERRVITLWQEAKKQDFSTEDLEAIMMELKEFEEKIEDHDKAHRASLSAEIKHRSDFKKPVDKLKTNEQKSLYDRAKEMGIDIHHTMKNLRHRISQGGNWNEEL
nr:alpha-2-macroglobulin receptor-associated protein-like [Lytechinus pictus]XP_054774137.1 alpha-2-macroglobulin receptor-associated protein-like [Lytechinus pictus]